MINYVRSSVIRYHEFSRLSLFTEEGLFLSSILTDDQREVLGAVLNGHNIFLAGAAGSGKSHLVGKISELCKEVLGITSTTGRAAKLLKGRTIHSFAGIGDCHEPKEVCHQLLRQYFSEWCIAVTGLHVLISA